MLPATLPPYPARRPLPASPRRQVHDWGWAPLLSFWWRIPIKFLRTPLFWTVRAASTREARMITGLPPVRGGELGEQRSRSRPLQPTGLT